MDFEGTVKTVLKELEIDTEDVRADTRLREDLQVDSTELVEIAVALERKTAIAVGTDDILAAQTFADLVACVEKAPRR